MPEEIVRIPSWKELSSFLMMLMPALQLVLRTVLASRLRLPTVLRKTESLRKALSLKLSSSRMSGWIWLQMTSCGFQSLGMVLPVSVRGKKTPAMKQFLVCGKLVATRADGCVIEAGDVVAELATGAAVASGCECGTIDMSFSTYDGRVCKECFAPASDTLFSCRGCSKEEPSAVSGLQGCKSAKEMRGSLAWVSSSPPLWLALPSRRVP